MSRHIRCGKTCCPTARARSHVEHIGPVGRTAADYGSSGRIVSSRRLAGSSVGVVLAGGLELRLQHQQSAHIDWVVGCCNVVVVGGTPFALIS